MATVAEFADRIMELIRADVAEGIVPADVKDFSDLHDHVDANMYLEDAGQVYDPDNPESIREINEIEDAITERLRNGALLNATQGGNEPTKRDEFACDFCPAFGDIVHWDRPYGAVNVGSTCEAHERLIDETRDADQRTTRRAVEAKAREFARPIQE